MRKASRVSSPRPAWLCFMHSGVHGAVVWRNVRCFTRRKLVRSAEKTRSPKAPQAMNESNATGNLEEALASVLDMRAGTFIPLMLAVWMTTWILGSAILMCATCASRRRAAEQQVTQTQSTSPSPETVGSAAATLTDVQLALPEERQGLTAQEPQPVGLNHLTRISIMTITLIMDGHPAGKSSFIHVHKHADGGSFTCWFLVGENKKYIISGLYRDYIPLFLLPASSFRLFVRESRPCLVRRGCAMFVGNTKTSRVCGFVHRAFHELGIPSARYLIFGNPETFHTSLYPVYIPG